MAEGIASGVAMVFLVALPLVVIAFALAWLLKEVPLRDDLNVQAHERRGARGGRRGVAAVEARVVVCVSTRSTLTGLGRADCVGRALLRHGVLPIGEDCPERGDHCKRLVQRNVMVGGRDLDDR